MKRHTDVYTQLHTATHSTHAVGVIPGRQAGRCKVKVQCAIIHHEECRRGAHLPVLGRELVAG